MKKFKIKLERDVEIRETSVFEFSSESYEKAIKRIEKELKKNFNNIKWKRDYLTKRFRNNFYLLEEDVQSEKEGEIKDEKEFNEKV